MSDETRPIPQRPQWLPPWYIHVTVRGNWSPLFLDARKIAAVLQPEGPGCQIWMHGQDGEFHVAESAPAVFAQIADATR